MNKIEAFKALAEGKWVGPDKTLFPSEYLCKEGYYFLNDSANIDNPGMDANWDYCNVKKWVIIEKPKKKVKRKIRAFMQVEMKNEFRFFTKRFIFSDLVTAVKDTDQRFYKIQEVEFEIEVEED
jgi:hypothetical protein